MPIKREVTPWQEFIVLLPDQERRVDLTAILNDLHRHRRVDFDRFYTALCEAMADAEAAKRIRMTLKEKQTWLRQRQGVLRKVESAEQTLARTLGGLDEPTKATLWQTTNHFSTESADQVHQQLREVHRLLSKEPVLQSSPHRLEGHQPQPWPKNLTSA